MCIRAILKNSGTLESSPNQYKTQELCNRSVDNYRFTTLFVVDWYKPQEMCIRAVSTCFVFCSVPDGYNIQEMCDKAFDNYANALKSVLDRYKTKEMCDKVVSKNPFFVKILSW